MRNTSCNMQRATCDTYSSARGGNFPWKLRRSPSPWKLPPVMCGTGPTQVSVYFPEAHLRRHPDDPVRRPRPDGSAPRSRDHGAASAVAESDTCRHVSPRFGLPDCRAVSASRPLQVRLHCRDGHAALSYAYVVPNRRPQEPIYRRRAIVGRPVPVHSYRPLAA